MMPRLLRRAVNSSPYFGGFRLRFIFVFGVIVVVVVDVVVDGRNRGLFLVVRRFLIIDVFLLFYSPYSLTPSLLDVRLGVVD